MPKPDGDDLAARVLRFVEEKRLLQPGPLVVAVSGGQDSVSMLDILRSAAPELGLEIRVAHLNHSFRGKQATEEAVFVRELAEGLGLPVYIGTIDVPAYRKAHRLSKQVAARYARFQFLARAAALHGAEQVALGHTSDDAVETLLLNLLRGAGLSGLGGLLPARPIQPGQLGPELESEHWLSPELPGVGASLIRIVRPILPLSRAETESYCRARSLPFRTDPSNLDTSYRRNWIRAELIPLLESQVPGARERLSDAAQLLADDRAVVDALVDRLWGELARAAEGRVEFDLDSWLELDEPIQRHLLRRGLDHLLGSLEDIGRVHIASLVSVIRSSSVGARVELPRNAYLEKGYNSLWLATMRADSEAPAALPAEPIILEVPGRAFLPSGFVEATVSEGAAVAVPEPGAPGSRWEALLDAEVVGPALEIRRRRPGDRFVPLGMTAPKKLQDFLVDEKVPRRQRDAVPIVSTPDSIVWVAGHRIDERFKVTPSTRRVLILKYLT